MSIDTIVTVLGAVLAAVVASMITVSMIRRSEAMAGIATSARHDQQIASLVASVAELRAESTRQWGEVRSWMERMSARLDAMDARLTRLESRLDERDKRGPETREALVRESVDHMREWCETRCDVRREQEALSGVHTTNPRLRVFDPEKP